MDERTYHILLLAIVVFSLAIVGLSQPAEQPLYSVHAPCVCY
jgi:hypothetical protein